MQGLTPTQKGAIAEAEVEAAAIRMGFYVLRPVPEGRRYDLVIDTGPHLLRVQCKWGLVKDGVVKVRTSTSRYTPLNGYVRTTYSAEEIDLIAVYADAIDRLFAVPIDEVAGQSYVHLRLTPSRNRQSIGVKWADAYPFGAVAQLGERLAGSQKVRGSSPLSSTLEETARQGGLFVV